MVFDQTASILVKESVNAARLAMVLEDPDKLNGLGPNAAKSLIDFAMKVQQNFQGRLDVSKQCWRNGTMSIHSRISRLEKR